MTHVQLCGRGSEVVGEDHQLARTRCSQEGGRREGVPGREEAGRVRRTGRTRRDVLAPDDEGESVRNETNLRDPPSCSHIRLFSLLSYRSSLHFSKRLHARS